MNPISPMSHDADRQPLHAQSPTQRFSDRAQDYAQYRPSYPTEAIAHVLAELQPTTTLTVADIGAGTGISSRLLADAGATVWAIEPNVAMRETAAPHPRVTFRAGTAEATGLADSSIDLVTCCQAFHWFRQMEALQEFYRILKPGGRVALLWNTRNTEDPFTAAHEVVIRSVADPRVFNRKDRKSAEALATSPLFTHYRYHRILWSRAVSQDALKGLALSSSYVPKEGSVCEQLLAQLDQLFDQWAQPSETGDRHVLMHYRTDIFLAEAIG
ncbi:class I SAM-dependent methyltransferase [Leptolyngbya sp. AN02str]|uniref:class I SAM-dependent methyltransferase n=1 Tax=Leptolyngbya sp. AN02str TaxID=3423363 RepID=UPI003D30F75F